jgi:hypothetical protein
VVEEEWVETPDVRRKRKETMKMLERVGSASGCRLTLRVLKECKKKKEDETC